MGIGSHTAGTHYFLEENMPKTFPQLMTVYGKHDTNNYLIEDWAELDRVSKALIIERENYDYYYDLEGYAKSLVAGIVANPDAPTVFVTTTEKIGCKAWTFLTTRAEYEYEDVKLKPLQTYPHKN